MRAGCSRMLQNTQIGEFAETFCEGVACRNGWMFSSSQPDIDHPLLNAIMKSETIIDYSTNILCCEYNDDDSKWTKVWSFQSIQVSLSSVVAAFQSYYSTREVSYISKDESKCNKLNSCLISILCSSIHECTLISIDDFDTKYECRRLHNQGSEPYVSFELSCQNFRVSEPKPSVFKCWRIFVRCIVHGSWLITKHRL